MKKDSVQIVVIDAGNTATSIARYRNGRVSHQTSIRDGIVRERDARTALLHAAGRSGANGAILASVTPRINSRWKTLVRDTLGVSLKVLTVDMKMAVSIRYPHPRTIGADRLANACGGCVRYGAPLIVADFGTALTFDVVSAEGAYIGGVIAPGLPLMTDYLYEKTALLPRIRLGGRCPPVGRSTEGAMRIGACIGYRGMVRETVEYLRETVGSSVRLCATGGYARWALRGLDLPFTIDSSLTLFGLGCIFELNFS